MVLFHFCLSFLIFHEITGLMEWLFLNLPLDPSFPANKKAVRGFDLWRLGGH
jgi:hypothetical protein